MARYDHLPIYRAAFDLAVHIEKLVRHFSRYHKYTLGTELRDGSRRILARIIEANDSRDRGPVLEHLRQELEWFKVLAQLCQQYAVSGKTVPDTLFPTMTL
jgi:23S rRNA-intervening sequence protein